MSDSSELDPDIWGPQPTREQLTEVNEWNEQQQREHIARVLDDCYTADNVAFLLGVSSQEIWRRMAEGEMIGLKFDTFHWVPKWQFDEAEDGSLKVNERVLGAKKVWGNLDEFGFCQMMTMEEPGYSEIRVNILLDGTNQDAISEVMTTLRNRGINYT